MSVLSKSAILTKITNWITTNHANLITGAQLNEILTDVKDSFVNITDQGLYTCTATYDATRSYVTGMTCVFNGIVYQCTGTTTGTFDSSKWTTLAGKIVKQLQTTNATATDIHSFTMPDNTCYLVTLRLIALIANGSSSDYYALSITGSILRRGASYSIDCDPNTAAVAGQGILYATTLAGFTGTIDVVHLTGNTIQIRAHGMASTTIKWTLEMETVGVVDGVTGGPPPPPTG